jgi:hypothetical protein
MIIVVALGFGWTDQLQFWTEDEIRNCITDPEINENLLRLHILVLKHLEDNIDVSEDEEHPIETGMDFTSP